MKQKQGKGIWVTGVTKPAYKWLTQMKCAGVSISVRSEDYKLTTKCKENVFRKGQIKGKIQMYMPDP